MLINVRIVGILTFMSRINFVLSLVKYEKSFITLGPVHPVSTHVGPDRVKLMSVQLWLNSYLSV